MDACQGIGLLQDKATIQATAVVIFITVAAGMVLLLTTVSTMVIAIIMVAVGMVLISATAHAVVTLMTPTTRRTVTTLVICLALLLNEDLDFSAAHEVMPVGVV